MLERKFINGLVEQALRAEISRYVVAAVIPNEQLEVLLLERPNGIYELPSGEVKSRESRRCFI
ncbi:MAG: hypothetical protein ACP5IJ_00345 [Candidatus Nanoarchaeia archaeon]